MTLDLLNGWLETPILLLLNPNSMRSDGWS